MLAISEVVMVSAAISQDKKDCKSFTMRGTDQISFK